MGSSFFRSLNLEAGGLEWIHPELPLAHPFEDGTAAVLYRSLDLTIANLGRDAHRYRRLFAPLVADWDKIAR